MGFAKRTNHLAPEGAYQVLAKAGQLEAAGKKIIHFEIGQPDYETFSNVSLAGIKAITEGKTRYTDPTGIPPLREVIAEDISRRRGITVHPDEVIVSPGGKPNLFFPTLALVEPGDEVIYKTRFSGFYETELDDRLKSFGAQHVVITGCTTSICVDSTVRDAMFRDYRCVLLADCMSEPIGDGAPRSNHDATLLTAELLFGWVSDSSRFLKGIER